MMSDDKESIIAVIGIALCVVGYQETDDLQLNTRGLAEKAVKEQSSTIRITEKINSH